MPVFRLPLSGNVTQTINPWTWSFNGSQFALVNIELGQSSNPPVEEEVLTDLASYGKQIGRIADALLVLIDHFPAPDRLTPQEVKAFAALKSLTDGVAKVKAKHSR